MRTAHSIYDESKSIDDNTENRAKLGKKGAKLKEGKTGSQGSICE